MKLVAEFRQGNGPMAMNAIDFYEDNGKIIKHSWAMGGESRKEVSKIPAEIEGYRKLTTKGVTQ